MNPTMGSVFTQSNNPIKSRSRTAGLGYDNKKVIWGTSLASILIACMRKYIDTTGETAHVLDETHIASVYTWVCGTLYEKIKLVELPAIQGPTARFMAKVLQRPANSKEVPLTDARTWVEMDGSTDGREAMGVVNAMIMGAQMVPEVMVHPISQLVRKIHVPIARKIGSGRDAKYIFAIPQNTTVSLSADPWEKMCSMMKRPALIIYINHRLGGKSENAALDALMSTMKESEIFGKSDLLRGMEVVNDLVSPQGF
jgi:hypothetical protein